MRRPRRSFTPDGLMAAVAVAGFIAGGALWSVKIHRLGQGYRGLAEHHASLADAQGIEGRMPKGQARERARYHDDLRHKYERAARYPWLPVAPDPPPP